RRRWRPTRNEFLVSKLAPPLAHHNFHHEFLSSRLPPRPSPTKSDRSSGHSRYSSRSPSMGLCHFLGCLWSFAGDSWLWWLEVDRAFATGTSGPMGRYSRRRTSHAPTRLGFNCHRNSLGFAGRLSHRAFSPFVAHFSARCASRRVISSPNAFSHRRCFP